MKKLITILTALLAIAVVTGCGEKTKEDKVADLKLKVEEIHDEAMEKIGEIRYYQDTLETSIDMMQVNGVDDSSKLEEYASTLKILNEADEEMMNWMRNYKTNLEEMEIKERMAYLKKEKKKIKEVNESIDESLEKASALIEE